MCILLLRYSHIINGYIGSKSFLIKLGEVVKKLKEVELFFMNFPVEVMTIYVKVNPSLIYVCDPVMGDTGPGLYVPK